MFAHLPVLGDINYKVCVAFYCNVRPPVTFLSFEHHHPIGRVVVLGSYSWSWGSSIPASTSLGLGFESSGFGLGLVALGVGLAKTVLCKSLPTASTNLYCLVAEDSQLAQGCTRHCSWWELNPWPAVHEYTALIIIITTTIFQCCHLRHQPYARVHCGSSGPKSVSARWPPTRRPGCKRDLWVRL